MVMLIPSSVSASDRMAMLWQAQDRLRMLQMLRRGAVAAGDLEAFRAIKTEENKQSEYVAAWNDVQLPEVMA